MGQLLSKKAKDDDYEVILAQLDEHIQSVEYRKTLSTARYRRVTALWTTYSCIVYFMWLLSFFFMQWPTLQWRDGVLEWFKACCPVVLVPAGIYSVRVLLRMYYKRTLLQLDSDLEAARAEQKAKVEEMKRTMKYYVAKQLIDRYDGSPAQKVKRRDSVKKPVTPQLLQRPVRQQVAPPQYVQPPPQLIQSPTTPPLQPSPQRMMPQQQPYPFMMPQYLQPQERSWIDRLMDMIVGEDDNANSSRQYALICHQCFAHNGLVQQQEVNTIQYQCPKCNYMNGPQHDSPSTTTAFGATDDEQGTPTKSKSEPRLNLLTSGTKTPEADVVETGAQDGKQQQQQKQKGEKGEKEMKEKETADDAPNDSID